MLSAEKWMRKDIICEGIPHFTLELKVEARQNLLNAITARQL